MLPFMSIKMAKHMFEALDYVKKNQNNFRYPVKVFHGKQDTVTNCENSRSFVYDSVKSYK